MPAPDHGPARAREESPQRGPCLVVEPGWDWQLVFDEAGPRRRSVGRQRSRVDPIEAGRGGRHEPLQELRWLPRLRELEIDDLAASLDPQPQGQGEGRLGPRVEPSGQAIGTRKWRSMRPGKRRRSWWLTRRSSPRLAKRRRTLVALVISSGRTRRSESNRMGRAVPIPRRPPVHPGKESLWGFASGCRSRSAAGRRVEGDPANSQEAEGLGAARRESYGWTSSGRRTGSGRARSARRFRRWPWVEGIDGRHARISPDWRALRFA
jgi:hypothetical protein